MRQFRYFFKEAFLNLRTNQSIAVVSTVTIAFTMMLFGLFLVMYLNLNTLVGSLRQEIKVILYLRDGISEKDVAALDEKLRSQSGISDATYISKEQALEDFQRAVEGRDILLRGLGDNPLPASFELTLEKTFQTSEAIRRMAEQLKGLKGVEDIQYGREWVDNVNTVLETMKVGSTLIGLILGLAAAVIISGTIRLTVWSRLEDIEVLRLIGATRAYIQMPFLLEGSLLGLFGGAISVLLLRGIYELARIRLAEMNGFLGSSLTLMFLPTPWLILFLAAGAGLGCAGSLLSIRRLL
ncbi:MAG: ABC transporter permease [Nitrospirae bacterium]|nr:ABC transporter permease [Nitrospirota bacterium]